MCVLLLMTPQVSRNMLGFAVYGSNLGPMFGARTFEFAGFSRSGGYMCSSSLTLIRYIAVGFGCGGTVQELQRGRFYGLQVGQLANSGLGGYNE